MSSRLITREAIIELRDKQVAAMSERDPSIEEQFDRVFEAFRNGLGQRLAWLATVDPDGDQGGSTMIQREFADLQMIPGINHPVFKDRPVNYDPREVWVRELFAERGEYNAFHEYYRALVEALYKAKVSRNVYCVNIDAVISALLLKILWRPYCSGALSGGALETAAFTIFLYARMLGCAAEIDDHLNRGRNMDTRTPTSQCRFVA